jgi:hypothetical protein
MLQQHIVTSTSFKEKDSLQLQQQILKIHMLYAIKFWLVLSQFSGRMLKIQFNTNTNN